MIFVRMQIVSLAALAASCASGPAPDAPDAPDAKTTPGRVEAAYRQCLKDSQAVAMSWTAIEAMCHERAEAEPDPLGAKED